MLGRPVARRSVDLAWITNQVFVTILAPQQQVAVLSGACHYSRCHQELVWRDAYECFKNVHISLAFKNKSFCGQGRVINQDCAEYAPTVQLPLSGAQNSGQMRPDQKLKAKTSNDKI